MSIFKAIKKVKIANEECNYSALAFSAMKRTVPPGMSEMLKENGDYEDILQDARCAAQHAFKSGMNAKEAFNLAQREIYAGMKACGYFREAVRSGRPGRWERRTVGSDDLDTIDHYRL